MSDDSQIRKILIAASIALLTLIVGGLMLFFAVGTNAPVGLGWYFFSFATGLTMIVMPCTLPLAFVIVPLSMGKGPIKGLSIALAFGLGVSFTLSLYGVLAALLGGVAIGTLGAPLEVVKNWLYFIAGGLAYIFALGELGLIRFRMPTYSGAAPAFIQKQQDVVKALMLGLFMGNIGVGCPHPATPVILTRIAVSGDIFYGWLLFFVHAAGRVLPLLFLALLGILGVNALSWLVSRKDKLERATGWGMVFVAGFIMVLGLFTHDWWVYSGQHTLLEDITQEERFIGALINRFNFAGAPHAHGMPTGTGLFGLPLGFGNWVLVFLWLLPIWWAFKKRWDSMAALPDDEKKLEQKLMPIRLEQTAVLSIVIILAVVFIFPDRFYSRSGAAANAGHGHDASMTASGSGAMDHGDHGMTTGTNAHAGHTALTHEEADITDGLAINITPSTLRPVTNTKVNFDFFVNQKPASTPVTDLDLSHEKLMHVIGVRDDMNEFFHIHPAQASKAGHFAVTHTFTNPGNYKLWSEVTQAGTGHVVGHPPITVTGDGDSALKEVSFGRSVIAGGYQVQLGYSGSLVKGKELAFTFDIHDSQGKEVEVEPYLGAAMHLSIIKDDWSQFIHTHPEEAGGHSHSNAPNIIEAVYADEGHDHAEGAGGMMAPAGHGVSFHATLPEAGVYRAFAQFRPKGSTLPSDEAITAAFWLNVEEKPKFPINPWWFLLVTSLIAIGVLSWGTRKYLNPPEKRAVTQEKHE